MAKIKITQVKSSIKITKHQKAVLASLGLHKTLQSVEHEDTPNILGMVHKMKHLLHVEEVK
jgi:large subunit ribosomal protein L30